MDRCPHCSFDPTSRNDYCDKHKPRYDMPKKQPPPVTVKQPEIDPVPLEVMASIIVAISEGVKALRRTRLTDKALYMLIAHAAPKLSPGKYGTKVPPTVRQVRAVLEGIEALEREYLKPAK
jgi:hypothetical protein